MLVALTRANADRINTVEPASSQAFTLLFKGKVRQVVSISCPLTSSDTGLWKWTPSDSIAMAFSAGRIISVTELEPDTLSPTRFVTRYSYDSNGVFSRLEKRSAALVASRAEIHYDMPTRVLTWSSPDSLYPGTQWKNRYYFGKNYTLDSMVTSDSESVTFRYQYDPLNRPLRMEIDYGSETTYEMFTYADGLLRSRVTGSSSDSVVRTWDYQYLDFDSLGNWTRMQVTSPELPAANTGYIRRIEYQDSL